MSVNHINAKIAELLGPHKETLADELDKAKAIYEAERDKFNHKEKKRGGLTNSAAAVPVHITSGSSYSDGPHRSLSSPALSASSETSSKKPKRDSSKESMKVMDSSDSRRDRTPSGAPRRLPLVKDNSSASISSSSAAPQTPVSAQSTATTSTASGTGAKRSSGTLAETSLPRRIDGARLSHQESASHFVHEETPLTESSEEADAYANIKAQIRPSDEGTESSGGSASASSSESSSSKNKEPEPVKPPKRTSKPTSKPVVPPKGVKKS
jgi:hypothetical protein